jgi:carotenoid cleavage dioxygenase
MATYNWSGLPKLYTHDLETSRRLVHEFGDTHLPGESVFVPGRLTS